MQRSGSTPVATIAVAAVALGIGFWLGGWGRKADVEEDQPSLVGLPGDAMAVAKERELSPGEVTAALATYVPPGRYDDYIMFSSGGHSGQMLAIGLPSMRILKSIAAFSPDSWQGYGYGVKGTPLDDPTSGSFVDGRQVTLADTHHPALSETEGEYDGQYLFINDKINGRLCVVDLRDFETKQIVDNPLTVSNHGCTVTPNTEYILEGTQYSTPLGYEYAPISTYKENYRGLATFWKFDREKGRIDMSRSFGIELPPYWQDLADLGKGPSFGLAFMNSFNTEMATGGIEKGNPPFEAGASQRDMDYLHVMDWQKGERVAAQGKAREMKGLKVIPLDVAIAEGILYFIPEPKSPHGADVCPGGDHVVVAGKLDPHVTIYSVEKIRAAIEKKDVEGTDPFGVPILRYDATKEAQVELGLGPLHTVFDDQGYAYTSLFIESAVARWSLGGCKFQAPEKPWTLVGKIPVQYNIGHLSAAEGDTVSPDGKYLVSLNKWSVDRFPSVGPLLPQNLQLVDISGKGERMGLLSDMPMGVGEPHFAQIIKADKVKAWEVYPQVGWEPTTQALSDKAVTKGRIERKGDTVEIFQTAIRSHFEPEHIEVKKGQKIVWHLTNLERTRDATHGFAIPAYNVAASIEPGETITMEFTADKSGVFPFYCLEFCSALHLEMLGYLLVEP